MDTPSHGLWSYIIWSQIGAPWLAFTAGVLPDVVPFLPSVLHNWSQGKFMARLRVKKMPRIMEVYVHSVFHFTHSLIVAATASALTLLLFPGSWWILAWPLHIVVDVFTHARPEPTPFLWPLSSWGFNGRLWNWRYAAVNVALMAVAWIALNAI
jgi:membrane-bound metal-dependent hydrolase YbcI (DUF457 family)